MNENKINISIISHNQSSIVKNVLHELSNINIFNKIIVTINTKENFKNLKRFDNLPIQFVVNDTPKGFGENHNYAYKLHECDYFIVINPDVKLNELSFENLLDYFKFKDVYILAPTAIDKNNCVQDNARRFPSILTPVMRKLGLYNKNYYIDSNKYTSVDWLSGMFMIIKSNTFKKIKGFDENFFMYYEDVDLFRRIKIIGGKVLRINTEKIFHEGQKNSHKKIKYLLIHLKSMIYYHLKYIFKF